MGATKRMGELYVQAMNRHNKMASISVRFGNVIGSSGSFIPKIIAQIQSNSSVTITHPEASRFFMLASEAVLLILKAAVTDHEGEVFILDMGDPIKIMDLARDVITFYGKIPEVDIPIKYIGLRPGEKLHEELIFDGVEDAILRDGVYAAKPVKFDHKALIDSYEKMLILAGDARKDEIVDVIKKHVDIYTNTNHKKKEDI
jgi:FlaA1/EpsC-like NDP-sugar epimerase